jgi:drug/metabolite transporter (DMT)-like permease
MDRDIVGYVGIIIAVIGLILIIASSLYWNNQTTIWLGGGLLVIGGVLFGITKIEKYKV